MDKKKAGRPKTQWTDEQFRQFEALCQIQCTKGEICSVMGTSDKTLDRIINERYSESFSDVYKKYSANGKASLRRWQFDSARKGNATMQIWLGRQYLGQTEHHEIEQKGGNAININVHPATDDDVNKE